MYLPILLEKTEDKRKRGRGWPNFYTKNECETVFLPIFLSQQSSTFRSSLSLSLSFAHLIHGIVWSKKEENYNEDDDSEDDDDENERSSKLYQIKTYSYYFYYKPIWLLDRRWCWWSRECRVREPAKAKWSSKILISTFNVVSWVVQESIYFWEQMFCIMTFQMTTQIINCKMPFQMTRCTTVKFIFKWQDLQL